MKYKDEKIYATCQRNLALTKTKNRGNLPIIYVFPRPSKRGGGIPLRVNRDVYVFATYVSGTKQNFNVQEYLW